MKQVVFSKHCAVYSIGRYFWLMIVKGQDPIVKVGIESFENLTLSFIRIFYIGLSKYHLCLFFSGPSTQAKNKNKKALKNYTLIVLNSPFTFPFFWAACSGNKSCF